MGKAETFQRNTGGEIELEGLSATAKRILELIPQDGSIGNVRLRSKLGLSVEEYWKARKELLDLGLIEKGKGRGGSVSRTGKGLAAHIPLNRKTLVEEESALYSPLNNWADKELSEGVDFHFARVTAFLGSKEKKGKWSRPDVTYVQVTDYSNLPTPVVEVTSFEVKPHDSGKDLASVYEAAAHARWAHNCYLVVEAASREEPIDEVVEKECERLGVGLLTMFQSGDGYQFVEKLEPRTQSPDPKELNDYLDRVFSGNEAKKKEFHKWIRK